MSAREKVIVEFFFVLVTVVVNIDFWNLLKIKFLRFETILLRFRN